MVAVQPAGRRLPGSLLRYLTLIAGAVILAGPFFYMLSTSLKGQLYSFEFPPRFIPAHPTVQNFVRAWTSNSFGIYFANSLLVALATTVTVVVLTAMMAYAFARFQFAGKNLLYYTMLAMMMMPAMMLIIPQFVFASRLGLLNKLSGLVVVYAAGGMAFNTFLLRGFFEQLPRELEEAVLIDGGGYFTIFTRIILPLSTPALATVAIFSFLGAWDEYVWALTVINEAAKRTLPIAIANFQGQHASDWGLVFAASLIAVIPVLVVYLCMQRYFVQGLTAGAVKG
ncbi:MAG TPA: carbohydrate ABC transporter permease [Anaerolineae bacterium]